MRSELRLHRLVVGILAILSITFIAVLLSLSQSPSHQHVEVIASLVIVIAGASAFVMMGMVEEVVAFQFGLRHKRELLCYFSLGILSLVSDMYLAMADYVSLRASEIRARMIAFSATSPSLDMKQRTLVTRLERMVSCTVLVLPTVQHSRDLKCGIAHRQLRHLRSNRYLQRAKLNRLQMFWLKNSLGGHSFDLR